MLFIKKLKPFTCTLCDKSFAKKEDLTSHLKAHLNLKPSAQCVENYFHLNVS